MTSIFLISIDNFLRATLCDELSVFPLSFFPKQFSSRNSCFEGEAKLEVEHTNFFFFCFFSLILFCAGYYEPPKLNLSFNKG